MTPRLNTDDYGDDENGDDNDVWQALLRSPAFLLTSAVDIVAAWLCHSTAAVAVRCRSALRSGGDVCVRVMMTMLPVINCC